MLEWLKEILGDSYTEEIDKKVSAEIGKAFVAKGDFDAKNTEAKSLKNQLTEANKTIEGFKAMDMDGVRREAQEWKAKAEQAEKYIPLLDEVYKNDSLTAKLDGAPELAQQGANANETVKCNFDRGRMFTVDNMDNAETAGLAFGRLASEFIRTKVAPEVDAFRFASYGAGIF